MGQWYDVVYIGLMFFNKLGGNDRSDYPITGGIIMVWGLHQISPPKSQYNGPKKN